MHADRTNRVVLTVFALLMVAAGVGGLLGATGTFGTGFQHRDLLGNPVGGFVSDNMTWFWWAVAGLSLIVVLLCLRWVWAVLFSTERIGDLVVGDERRIGGTTLSARALTDALDAEIAAYRGVVRVRTRLVGDPLDPVVATQVFVGEDADVGGLRDRLDAEALAHARRAVGRAQLPARVDFTVLPERTGRVG